MRNMIRIGPVLFVALFLFAGCGGSVRPASLYQEVQPSQVNTAFVAKHPGSTRGMELYILKAVSDYGIKTSVGPEESRPSDVDLYIDFVDRWQWDFALYLNSLVITVRDARTGALLAAGKYETTGLHTWPDPERITREVVDSIMQKMGLSKTRY